MYISHVCHVPCNDSSVVYLSMLIAVVPIVLGISLLKSTFGQQLNISMCHLCPLCY